MLRLTSGMLNTWSWANWWCQGVAIEIAQGVLVEQAYRKPGTKRERGPPVLRFNADILAKILGTSGADLILQDAG